MSLIEIPNLTPEQLEHWRKQVMHRGGGLRRWLPPEFPKIVCLCGSTRFRVHYEVENAALTRDGYIVLSVGFFGDHELAPITVEDKAALDELHLRKIDLCDEVRVLNVGGYIGDSTRREIVYAEDAGKTITYLEPLA